VVLALVALHPILFFFVGSGVTSVTGIKGQMVAKVVTESPIN
jgi:hypothetical protein